MMGVSCHGLGGLVTIGTVHHPRSVTVPLRIGKMDDTASGKNVFASFNAI
jgi:hypothetical protein